jgi:magnesium transporter
MITENLLSKSEFSWIDVQKPLPEDLERLHTEFNLPYLLVQDCLRPEHLPKYEEAEDSHFLMLRSYDEDSGIDDTTIQDLSRKIALFIRGKELITIHRVELDFLDHVVEKTRKNEFPKTLHGLLHSVIMSIIRTYERPIDRLQDMYDDFEHEILAAKVESLSTTRIYNFRRQLFLIKRLLKQTNDTLHRFREFWEENPSLLQDLKENIDQLYFTLDDLSNSFEHLFQLHISLNDQRGNDVVKVLTIFSTVLLPLNFLASFYGMNFKYLPGLESEQGIYILAGLMLVTVIGTIWVFKRKGWFQISKE